MSQAPVLIGPNKSGLTYRQEDNDGKQALLSHHKGAIAPAYAEAGTIWLDDAATPWLLKVYDGVDWICLSQIHAGSNTVLPYSGQQASRGLVLCADSGTANAYQVSLSPAASSYSVGLCVLVKVENTNTGSSTLAVDGLTAVNIKMPDGGNTPAGALCAGAIYLLCYDGTVFKLLNPTKAQANAILQAATASYSGYALLSAAIPADDTIPTATEGTELLSVSITPSSASSRMVIRVTGLCATSAIATISTSVLVDGETSAFGAAALYADAASVPRLMTLTTEHLPGSTTPLTYKVRAGASAGSLRPNGVSSGRIFGGTAKWMMTVEEYAN